MAFKGVEFNCHTTNLFARIHQYATDKCISKTYPQDSWRKCLRPWRRACRCWRPPRTAGRAPRDPVRRRWRSSGRERAAAPQPASPDLACSFSRLLDQTPRSLSRYCAVLLRTLVHIARGRGACRCELSECSSATSVLWFYTVNFFGATLREREYLKIKDRRKNYFSFSAATILVVLNLKIYSLRYLISGQNWNWSLPSHMYNRRSSQMH